MKERRRRDARKVHEDRQKKTDLIGREKLVVK